MILSIQQGLQAEGFKVSMSQLCRWFEVPRRTAYYKPCKAAPKVQERFEKPIKAMIDQDPSFGYRTVAGLLKFNKNTVQRIFQIRGWQVKRKRPVIPSSAATLNLRSSYPRKRSWTHVHQYSTFQVSLWPSVIQPGVQSPSGCHLPYSRYVRCLSGSPAWHQSQYLAPMAT